MLLKVGVSLNGLHPIMRVVLKYVERYFWQVAGTDSIITSTTDGEHGPGSWHYVGLAIDFRRRHVSAEQFDAIIRLIRAKLNHYGFEVIVKPTHIHIEPSDALAKRLNLMP